jgi:hypothetical protein
VVANTRSCSACDRRANSGSTSALRRRGLVRQVLAQVVGRFADLALAGQEDQDVARRAPRHSSSTASAMASFRSRSRGFSSNGRQRCSTGTGAARHHDHRAPARRRPKCFAKRSASMVAEVTMTSGRAARQDLAQVAQQEVDVQAALVRLVDDDRVVGRSSGSVCVSASRMPSVISLTEAPGSAGREAHLVAHHLAQRRVQLLGDALGHAETGGDAARLGVADQAPCPGCPAAPRPPAPSASAILGSCVVLPEPVSPQTMTTWCFAHGARDLVALAR